MGIMSFFSKPKSRKVDQVPATAPTAPNEKGGKQLRSFSSLLASIPADKMKELVVGIFALNVASFEEKYAEGIGTRHPDHDFREASLVHNLLSNLVGGNYVGFLAAHALIYVNRLRGFDWVPSSQEEIVHIGETASVFLLHPHYQLTLEQQDKEQALLSQTGAGDGAQALPVMITTARWDVAGTVMRLAVDTLGRNLMEVWSGPEAHEQLVYQTLMLCLRTDNTIGALLLHQLAMAHHQRGWEWRPSPDEFHAVAENAARYLVEKRYNAAALAQ